MIEKKLCKINIIAKPKLKQFLLQLKNTYMQHKEDAEY